MTAASRVLVHARGLARWRLRTNRGAWAVVPWLTLLGAVVPGIAHFSAAERWAWTAGSLVVLGWSLREGRSPRLGEHLPLTPVERSVGALLEAEAVAFAPTFGAMVTVLAAASLIVAVVLGLWPGALPGLPDGGSTLVAHRAWELASSRTGVLLRYVQSVALGVAVAVAPWTAPCQREGGEPALGRVLAGYAAAAVVWVLVGPWVAAAVALARWSGRAAGVAGVTAQDQDPGHVPVLGSEGRRRRQARAVAWTAGLLVAIEVVDRLGALVLPSGDLDDHPILGPVAFLARIAATVPVFALAWTDFPYRPGAERLGKSDLRDKAWDDLARYQRHLPVSPVAAIDGRWSTLGIQAAAAIAVTVNLGFVDADGWSLASAVGRCVGGVALFTGLTWTGTAIDGRSGAWATGAWAAVVAGYMTVFLAIGLASPPLLVLVTGIAVAFAAGTWALARRRWST